MKRCIHSFEDILCMSNIRGRKIKVTGSKPFSFYFSSKNSSHSIRVRPIFNPDKIRMDKVGTLKLSDDWSYIPGPDDKHVSKSDIEKMKQFFKENIVLFAAVWDNQLYDTDVEDYLYGEIDLQELIQQFPFYEDYEDELENVKTISEFTEFCRANNLVNLYGN